MNAHAQGVPGGSDSLALDALYNLRGHPDRDRVYADFTQRSATLRDTVPTDLDVAYADHALARLDVFHTLKPRGVMVFIHGGYWRALNRSLFSFLAQPFLDQGWIVVMPDYPLAPSATLDTIVEHTFLAVDWVEEHIARANGQQLPVVVCGHSAGGHLAALCTQRDHLLAPGNQAGVVNTICTPIASIPISGLFDLAPLQKTNVNEQLQFTNAQIAAYSPMQHPCAQQLQSLVIVGGDETGGFKWQSEAYTAHLHQQNVKAQLHVAQALNHFTILDALADTGHPLNAKVLKFIQTLT